MSMLGSLLLPGLKFMPGAPARAHTTDPTSQFIANPMSAQEIADRAEDQRLRGIGAGAPLPPAAPPAAPTGFGPTDSRLLEALRGGGS